MRKQGGELKTQAGDGALEACCGLGDDVIEPGRIDSRRAVRSVSRSMKGLALRSSALPEITKD